MKDETIELIANDIFLEISRWEYPADRILNKFFRSNRSINSRNRRAIQAKVYEKIRAIKGYPDFLEQYVPENWPQEFAALCTEAPVDLRMNSLKAKRDEIKLDGAAPTPYSAFGLRLNKRVPLELDGKYEIQDEASQLVTQFAGVKVDMRVLDYCAGGGGKSLALAALMQNKGELICHDANADRMKNLPKRLQRAGVKIAKIKKPEGLFDVVFVDSPCSGSGTWRRNPDLKWRMKEAEIEQLLKTQQQILQEASAFVKSGGNLIYVTCSLFPAENEVQIAYFLSNNKNFKIVEEQKYSPFKTNTDGFYACKCVRLS